MMIVEATQCVRVGLLAILVACATHATGQAQQTSESDAAYGPYSAEFLQAGRGLTKSLEKQDCVTRPGIELDDV